MKKLLVGTLFIVTTLMNSNTNCGYHKYDLQDQNRTASKFSKNLHDKVIKLAELKGTPGTTDKCLTDQEQKVESEKAAASIWMRRTTPNKEDLSPSKEVLMSTISIATKIVGADYDQHVTQGHSGSHAPIRKAYVSPEQNLEDIEEESMEE